jgi:hypothetical protein
MRGIARSLLLALTLVAAAGSPAWSHVGVLEVPASTPAPVAAPLTFLVAATPEATPIWPLVAVLVAVALAALPPRRAVAFALVLLLALFAVESGVHSVHHLADQQGAAQCVVAAASAHVHGLSLDAPVDALWLPTPVGTVVVADPTRPGARLVRSDEGRAPPA